MTRKEAIDILMSANVWNDEERTAWEVLVPELAESDDERIRRKMIDHFKAKTKETWCNMPVKDIIAYLEKQKDLDKMIVVSPEVWDNAISDAFENGKKEGEKQKENPKSADSIPSDCTSDAKCEDRWHKVKDSLPNSTREVLCKDAIGNFFIGRYYKSTQSWEVVMYDDCDKSNEDNPPVVKWCEIPSEKQKEQKPAEWSPTKEQMVALSWAANGMLDNDSPSAGDIKASLRSLYNGLQSKLIKPAVWSEEDKAFLKVAIAICNRYSHKDIADWLKSLSERFNLQPKQEWSEEDEKELDCIINILDRLGYEEFCKSSRDQDIEEERFYYKEIQFLKRLKSLRPSWKPSEEQMKALEAATVRYQSTGLESLYEDLKKL